LNPYRVIHFTKNKKIKIINEPQVHLIHVGTTGYINFNILCMARFMHMQRFIHRILYSLTNEWLYYISCFGVPVRPEASCSCCWDWRQVWCRNKVTPMNLACTGLTAPKLSFRLGTLAPTIGSRSPPCDMSSAFRLIMLKKKKTKPQDINILFNKLL
jgi:hypothetical protein